MRIVGLLVRHLVNFGRRSLVNPRRLFTLKGRNGRFRDV